MSQHTPGPWQFYWREEDGEANCGVFFERRKGQAFAVARCPRYVMEKQWKADGALIAAAPDLLEALEEAIECGLVPKSSALEGGALRYSSQVKCADKIRAAIAKAKGEA